jgi:hypothetical protein
MNRSEIGEGVTGLHTMRSMKIIAGVCDTP